MTTTMAEQSRQNIIEAVKNYGRKLFYFIRGRVNTDEDAEDILQDVWYQFTNVINSEPIEKTSAWLYRVARNRIIDKYRSPAAGSFEDINPDEEGEEPGLGEILLTADTNPESEQLREIFWKTLFSALDELPPEQKHVFVWHELEDIPFHYFQQCPLF